MTPATSLKEGFQGPVTPRIATDIAVRFRICKHPAFRLGFLDALRGLPFNHDDIMGRIERETPASSLKRTGWNRNFFSTAEAVERAQYRYEEGRLTLIKYGLRCKGWNHPDYPPRSVIEFARNRPDNEWL